MSESINSTKKIYSKVSLKCLINVVHWLKRSPGEGKGYPLEYAGLENSMDCIFHRVA